MELQTLIDERDIARALSTFARILDSKRWEDLGDVFAAEVAFDYGTGEEQSGMEAMRANMARFLDVCGQTQHFIGSVLIDVDGDHAISRAYVQARHQAVDGRGGPVFDTNGEYIDRWERLDEGWRIVRRDVQWSTFFGDAAIIMGAAGD